MHVQHLGRRAFFLIPSLKAYDPNLERDGKSVSRRIHEFLTGRFQGYSASVSGLYGYFFTSKGRYYDEHRAFRVVMNSSDPSELAALQEFLGELAADLGEECIYLEFGGDAMLVYPE